MVFYLNLHLHVVGRLSSAAMATTEMFSNRRFFDDKLMKDKPRLHPDVSFPQYNIRFMPKRMIIDIWFPSNNLGLLAVNDCQAADV